MPCGKVTARSKNQIAKVQAPAPQPQWPPLRPLVPTEDLYLEPLLEDQIIVIRNLFTSTLCRTYAAFLSTLPLITTPERPKDGDAVRVNDRIEFDDPGFAETLWKATGLESLVSKRLLAEGNGAFHPPDDFWGGEVVGLNPRIRIYRYKEGHFFAQHYDDSNAVSLPTSPPTLAKTTWTLLIYLTGSATGCMGGETVFYPESAPARSVFGKKSIGREPAPPVVVELEVGTALLHKHGQDCLLHEGRKVTRGEKWVIRSDICVKL